MLENDVLQRLAQSVLNYDIDGAKSVAREAIEHGIDPVSAVENGLAKGLKLVGDKFGQGEAFLTDLMLAAEAMSAGLEILKPELAKSQREAKSSGKVVIGTVRGDIHDIGKNMVVALLVANGFEVIDLGVDVLVDRFIDVVRERKTDILGLSSLMSTTAPEQKKTIEALRDENLRSIVKVLVGGGQVTKEWAEQIGADGTGSDASEGVKAALSLMEKH